MPYYNRDPRREPNFDNHPHGWDLVTEVPHIKGYLTASSKESTNTGVYMGGMGLRK